MKRTLRIAAVAVAIVVSMGAWTAYATPVPVEKGRATVDDFQAATSCGCHSQLIDQWSRSMHAKALSDPLYLTKLEEAQKATDGAIGPFCNTCHGPAATMAGEGSADPRSPSVADGVTCSWCHQVTGLKPGKPANTSHLVELSDVRRAQIKDPVAPHPAEYSAFHETAEFCGGCHNVDHPVNGMHLEATYTEYAESPWATEGVTCQDCHMSRAPGVIGPFTGQAAGGAPERPNIYAMTFIGANVAQGDAQAATALLQSAAEIKLEAPQILESGEAQALVTVTNVGAGHYLPTGLTEVREMWLEVFAEGPDGTRTDLLERKFGTILQDDKGNSPVELWEAVSIKSDDRIPPRESITETATFSLPAGADNTTVKAVLRYRSASDEFAKKAGVENPITDMASAEQVVWSSEEARAAAQTDPVRGAFPKGWAFYVAIAGLVIIGGIVWWFLAKGRRQQA